MTTCPLCGLWPHAAGCPAQIIEYVQEDASRWMTTGWDEPMPMTRSWYLWLLSGRSQRQFEAEVLAHGRN